MNRKTSLIIGITALIVGFAVAVLFLMSTVPYAFSSCGKQKIERKDITSIRVKIFSENGEVVYSCEGDYGSVTLNPDTDYTIKIDSPTYHYGNSNGAVGFGYLPLSYIDVGVDFDSETISIVKREQEDEKIIYGDRSGYDNLQYTLRGSECVDKVIRLNYSSEFKSKCEGYSFTPCSFKISFA